MQTCGVPNKTWGGSRLNAVVHVPKFNGSFFLMNELLIGSPRH
uniref:Uncharacterized protein n=1 Tax=Anguilla anguilla TaxID=7936 RepID=A0A0E9PV47_ANGAN